MQALEKGNSLKMPSRLEHVTNLGKPAWQHHRLGEWVCGACCSSMCPSCPSPTQLVAQGNAGWLPEIAVKLSCTYAHEHGLECFTSC